MAFTGNSSYGTTNYTAFAVEKSVAKDWQKVWTTSTPLLTAIADNGHNFNQGFTLNGNRLMVIPVMGDDLTNPASGIADANELNSDTVGITNGFSQASYSIAHYRTNVTYRASENYLAKDGALGNILEGKKAQVIESFRQRWENDAATTTIDSRTKILGYRYALSTSNAPGGIDQGTDTQWAASVKTSAGTFALSLIDDQIDTIMSEGRGKPDLILAGRVTGSNMFGKIRTAIGPTAEQLVNPNGMPVKYGLTSIQYLGADVVLDSKSASGEINVLSTSSWYALVPKAPSAGQMIPLAKTDALIQSYTLFTALGCGDPSVNARITGIT